MPWCPKCGTEYREGYTACADCHVPLVAERPAQFPAQPGALAAITDPVAVYETGDSAAAEMICEMLRNADIAAATRDSDPLGAVAKLYTGSSFMGVHIVVDRSQAAQAQEVLRVWAGQDARAPVSEEELARLALQDIPEDELAREAEAEAPRPAEWNRPYGLAKWAVLGLVVLVALLIWLGRLI